jgi:uncharacterized membrane protein YeaQ/YmgE (transglycosylase-associated protein family)
MLVALLVFALEGLIVGALARLALPGPDPMSIWMTIALGLAGSVLAGLVTVALWHRAPGFVISVLGATFLLYLYRRYAQHRGIGRRIEGG